MNVRGNPFDPFALDIFDPFDDYFPFAGSGEYYSSPPRRRGSSSGANRSAEGVAYPRVDWRETAEAHVFKADLPGLKKGHVKVEVDGRLLQFSGERRHGEGEEDKGGKWRTCERGAGKFFRRFKLPKNAALDQVRAAMEDGVLTVIVPKRDAAAKAELKAVEIA